ncbi:AMP-binding protein [Brevibacterium sp. SMBL_HHYL_HB1]|uniref:class I adenylate-forming enzyme family protein n=1 Tax=Brevibacterium sp. SMBL_HHYL_HB1 TaxID=2777556 RepID=UPI001BA50211|nr:AMP-binding protein [Brevibacterium sp. SMBL_HHYL_HB1]QUL80974.1 AMP-binding protein [Brevibacterium sp. SMBL_HHYL_HB1]
MTNSWFETRPWIATLGEVAQKPYVLEDSTPLADLAATVEARGDAEAISYYGFTLTWKEFDRWSTAFAAFLAEQGVRPGDRIGIYEQNTPAFAISTYAIWKAGGAVVPLNPMYRGELEHIFTDAQVTGLIVSKAAYLDRVENYATGLPLVVLSDDRSFQTDGPEAIFSMFEALPEVPGLPDFETAARDHLDTDFTPHSPAVDDLALIAYTSGTSGRSKGAAATHANVSSNSRYCLRNSVLGPGDGYVSLAPLFHITGFICQFLAAVAGGARLILNYRFEPGSLIALCDEQKPAYMAGPATVYTAMMAHPDFDAEKFASFKSLMSGGAPLPEGLVRKFEQRAGIYVGQGYGLSETCAQVATVPHGFQAPVDPDSGNLACGLPQPDVLIRILDDDGEPVGPGEVGEVAVSGPQVVREYLNNAQATAEQIPNGELRTGDVGFMREDGWLFIVDRKKDMINASGFKVWPREVEDVLYTHPAVQEVAVVGIPDEYRGEDVAAFVTLHPDAEADAEEIMSFCRARLASYKAPHRVTFIDQLPKTSSGKILRRTIRAEAVEAAEAAREAAASARKATTAGEAAASAE